MRVKDKTGQAKEQVVVTSRSLVDRFKAASRPVQVAIGAAPLALLDLDHRPPDESLTSNSQKETFVGKSASLAYRPVGLLASVAAGAVASAIFKQIWRRVADEEDAPDALQSEYSLPKILLAAAIQGAIFAAVKALIDRAGARGYEKLTGSWPGN